MNIKIRRSTMHQMSACVSSYNYNNEMASIYEKIDNLEMSSIYDRLDDLNKSVGNPKTELSTVYDLLKEMDKIVSALIVPDYVEQKPEILAVQPEPEPDVIRPDVYIIQFPEPAPEPVVEPPKIDKAKKNIAPKPAKVKAPVCLVNPSEDPAVVLPPPKEKKENPWIKFLQDYSADHQISYHQALHTPNIKVLYQEWKIKMTPQPKIEGLTSIISLPKPDLFKPEIKPKTMQAVRGIIVSPDEESPDYAYSCGDDWTCQLIKGKRWAFFFTIEAYRKGLDLNEYENRDVSATYKGKDVPMKYQWI